MSTLKVNNIKDTSGGTSNLKIDGAAKAWVNFNGTGTVAIRDDLNVSSVTDHGTGVYGVNFTSNMSNANYCFNVSTGATFNIDVSAFQTTLSHQTTSQLNMTCRYSSSDSSHERDCEIVCASIFGD